MSKERSSTPIENEKQRSKATLHISSPNKEMKRDKKKTRRDVDNNDDGAEDDDQVGEWSFTSGRKHDFKQTVVVNKVGALHTNHSIDHRHHH